MRFIRLVFFMVLPSQYADIPQIRGIRQIKVRLFQPAPEPAREPVEKIDNRQPAQAVGVKERPGKKDAPAVARQRRQLKPVERKKNIVRKTLLEDQFDPEKELLRSESGQQKIQERQMDRQTARTEQAMRTRPAVAEVEQAVPRYEVNRPPEYPDLARRRGWEGTVLLEVEVAGDGEVRSVRVHTSSSYGLLDEAALAAVGKWLFKPGMRDGKPWAMKVLVPVHFVLKDAP